MKTYDVLTETEDGIELWKEDLSFEEAQAEIKIARVEYGGKYWMAPARANPLEHIPAARIYK